MNYKNVFKRETKVIAYVVIALTLVVIGTSYALFLQVNNNRDNQVVTAGSLVMEYSKYNTVNVDANDENNCLVPQEDSTGSSSGGCAYTLSITNKGTLPMQYNLLIYNNTKDAPSGAKFVDHSLIRHSLNKQNSKEGSNSQVVTKAKALSELTLKDNKRVLETSVIGVGETITFSLKIWISSNATTDIIGQYVYLKLDVVGTVYEQDNATKVLTNSIDTNSMTEIVMPSTYSTQKSNNEYRFNGKNPNNYVYFNCEDDNDFNTCEVWRILGIYNDDNNESHLKLIKNTSEELMAFSDNNANFASSGVKAYLNETFYNSLSATAKNQISSFNYRLNGASSLDIGALEMYGEELSGDENVSVNVGLMSISDYAFASSSNEEDTIDNIAKTNNENWLYTGKNEWFINHNADNKIYSIKTNGEITTSISTEEKLVRPVLYLDSNIKIINGEGTSKSPYVLSK